MCSLFYKEELRLAYLAKFVILRTKNAPTSNNTRSSCIFIPLYYTRINCTLGSPDDFALTLFLGVYCLGAGESNMAARDLRKSADKL